MTMDNEAGRDPEVYLGAPVFTKEGDQIGTVKEIRGHLFKVDHRMGPDFWLQKQMIETATKERVQTQIPKDDLDQYKVKDHDDQDAIRTTAEDNDQGRPRYGENPASATIDAAEGRPNP